MKFEKDIFISYAHIDEEEMTTDEMGWVSAFHHDLEVRVKQVLGSTPVIWRDTQLQANDDYSKEITDQFPKTKMMVSIISPRYLKSDWCKKEVDEFYDVADKHGGVYIGNKGRILKVVKTYIPVEKLPEKIQKMLQYDFYKFEDDSKVPVEFDRKYGKEMEVAYTRKLNVLSYNIKDLIEQIDEIQKSGQPLTKRKVYVAETSYDLKEYRDMVIDELSSNGYDVYPEKNLSRDFSENYKAEVLNCIKDCTMSVHLIGSGYGNVMDGSPKSIVVLQNEVAEEQSNSRGLERMVWIAPRNEKDDPQIVNYIKQLDESETFHKHADVLKGTMDEFKSTVVTNLKKQDSKDKEIEEAKKNAQKISEGDSTAIIDAPVRKFIYIICFNEADKEAATPVDDSLFEMGYDIVYPLFDNSDDADKRHQEQLRNCDAILIYYGNGDENWFNAILSSLDVIPSLKRTKKLLATGVYLAAPTKRYRSHTYTVINGASELNKFTTKLK